jgi:hypothetical protein
MGVLAKLCPPQLQGSHGLTAQMGFHPHTHHSWLSGCLCVLPMDLNVTGSHRLQQSHCGLLSTTGAHRSMLRLHTDEWLYTNSWATFERLPPLVHLCL